MKEIFLPSSICVLLLFFIGGGRGRRCIFCILNAVFILFFIHFEATYYTSLMTLWEEDAGKEKWRKVAEGMERSQMRGPKRCLPSPVKCWVVRKSLGVRSLSIEDSHELLSLFYPRFWMLILDVNLEEITHQMFPNYFINYFLFRYFFFHLLYSSSSLWLAKAALLDALSSCTDSIKKFSFLAMFQRDFSAFFLLTFRIAAWLRCTRLTAKGTATTPKCTAKGPVCRFCAPFGFCASSSWSASCRSFAGSSSSCSEPWTTWLFSSRFSFSSSSSSGEAQSSVKIWVC